MGILIKDMEKPTICYEIINGEPKRCPFLDGYDDCVILRKKGIWTGTTWEEQYSKCPLVEVPEPHGRLVDGDALWNAMSKYHDNEGAKFPFGYDDASILKDSACFVIENAPTVIEAEGE